MIFLHHRTLRLLLAALLVLLSCGCKPRPKVVLNLKAERAAHKTQLTREELGNGSFETPPKGAFDFIHYASPAGVLGAYISPDPKDEKRHPLIIWLVGGFDNSISSLSWDDDALLENDQTASAYRKAGIAMMYPSLRGGNDNPGVRECLYGEVDDVLAAVQYARSLDWVDPKRIYLGGHSSGAGLALLTAECAEPGEFRAVIALGPVADMKAIGQKRLPFDMNNAREARLRSPVEFLPLIKARTVIVEGDGGDLRSFDALRERNHNALLSFTVARGYTHFTAVAPVNAVLAEKVAQDTGPEPELSINLTEIKSASKALEEGRLIPAGDVRIKHAQSGVVLYHSSNPEELKASVRKSLAADEELKTLPVYSSFKEARKPPFIVIEEEQAPFKEFPLPTEHSFQYTGMGMEPSDIAAILQSKSALSFYWVVDTGHCWDLTKKFNALAGSWAETFKACIWDPSARQCFTVASWQKNRIQGWGNEKVPDLRSQINLHVYQHVEGKAEVRAVTLGMAKFGLPDVVIPDSPGSRSAESGCLIRLVCQTLASRPVVKDPKHFTVDTSAVEPASAVPKFKEMQFPNGTGKGTLSLIRSEPEEGDEDNWQIALTFNESPGSTPAEKYSAFLKTLWGTGDDVFQVKHDAAIENASKEARERLKTLAPEFNHGMPPLTELLVKAPFKVDEGDGREWMWVEVQSWKPGGPIKGLLQNDPFQIKGLRRGAQVTVQPDEVFDYLLTRPDGTTEGNETGKLLDLQKKK